MTHKHYLKKLLSNDKFITGELKLLSEYIEGTDPKIYVQTFFGICYCFAKPLLRGHNPTILTSINKTSYFINKCESVHKGLFNYSLVDYIKSNVKVKIICSKHGIFEQTPRNHLSGRGCNKCKQENSNLKSNIQEFIKKADIVHSGRYKYPLNQLYINAKTNIIVNCNLHGDFSQTPDSHLRGNGCPICNNNSGWSKTDWCSSGITSLNFDSYKLYIIRLFNSEESFYKIGITFNHIKTRLKSFPYECEIIKVLEGDCEFIYNLEKEYHRKHKKYSYIPKLQFGGMYECFYKLNNI